VIDSTWNEMFIYICLQPDDRRKENEYGFGHPSSCS
jgi:hypothetical protein